MSVTIAFGNHSLEKIVNPTREELLLEIGSLSSRVSTLIAKINELSMRPRMPYTQGANVNDLLKLVENGNIEPEWVVESLSSTIPSLSSITESILPTFTFTLSGSTSKSTSSESSSSSSSSSSSESLSSGTTDPGSTSEETGFTDTEETGGT